MTSKIIPELGITLEQTQSMLASVVASLVKDGFLNTEGKTFEQFTAEFEELLSKTELTSVTDHTDDILKQARIYKKAGKKEFACLFYALWLEHSLNSLVSSLATRKKFSSKEIGEIIRDTSYKSKSSWLLHMLGGESFSQSHINLIVKLMEARNSFVHYKWKADNEQVEKEIESILSKIEKTVKYIHNYERKHLLGISKRKIEKFIKRA